MDVSVLIVNTNDGERIITSIQRLSDLYPNAEIIVADNCSTDGSVAEINSRFPGVKVISTGKNAGYSGGNNLAARTASRKYLFVFNPDALVTAGCLEPLVARIESDKNIGAVGPKVYKGWLDGGDLLESAGATIEFPLGEGPTYGYLQRDSEQFCQPRDVAYLSGASFLIRRSTFLDFGGFDERLWCYYEETDLFWRMRMTGLRCVYEPRSSVYHMGSANFGSVSARKIYLQTRNRIIVNLQNLEFMNVMRFVAAELIVGSCVQAGAWIKRPELGRAYTHAWASVLSRLLSIAAVRRDRQRRRSVPDAEVLKLHVKIGVVDSLRRYVNMVKNQRKTLFGPV